MFEYKKFPNVLFLEDFGNFPEETDNFYFGFVCKSRNLKESSELLEFSELKICHKSNMDVIYRQKIHIYHEDHLFDYWFRFSIYKEHLILSDFSGIKIFNSKLEIVHQIDIYEEMKIKHDVFGYEVKNNTLLVWSADEATKIKDMYDLYVEGEIEKIKSLALTKKNRNIEICKIPVMDIYESSFNIGNNLIHEFEIGF